MDDVKHEVSTVKKTPHRWQKGECPNPKGRPTKPEIEELRNAIKTVEQKKKKSLLQHFTERAFENDNVLIALIKKFVPDKTSAELNAEITTIQGIIIKTVDKEVHI